MSRSHSISFEHGRPQRDPFPASGSSSSDGSARRSYSSSTTPNRKAAAEDAHSWQLRRYRKHGLGGATPSSASSSPTRRVMARPHCEKWPTIDLKALELDWKALQDAAPTLGAPVVMRDSVEKIVKWDKYLWDDSWGRIRQQRLQALLMEFVAVVTDHLKDTDIPKVQERLERYQSSQSKP